METFCSSLWDSRPSQILSFRLNVPSSTGSQEGDPLGGILFTAPLQQLFNQIADTFPDIHICGGSGCFRNAPLIAAASYSTLAVTINWLHTHPIAFTWLQQPLLQTLVSFVNPNIVSLLQWNLRLPVTTTSPSPDIRDKQSLPLQIPSPDVISEWPAHLFPTQGDFGRHIKISCSVYKTSHSSPTTAISLNRQAHFAVIPVF